MTPEGRKRSQKVQRIRSTKKGGGVKIGGKRKARQGEITKENIGKKKKKQMEKRKRKEIRGLQRHVRKD